MYKIEDERQRIGLDGDGNLVCLFDKVRKEEWVFLASRPFRVHAQRGDDAEYNNFGKPEVEVAKEKLCAVYRGENAEVVVKVELVEEGSLWGVEVKNVSKEKGISPVACVDFPLFGKVRSLLYTGVRYPLPTVFSDLPGGLSYYPAYVQWFGIADEQRGIFFAPLDYSGMTKKIAIEDGEHSPSRERNLKMMQCYVGWADNQQAEGEGEGEGIRGYLELGPGMSWKSSPVLVKFTRNWKDMARFYRNWLMKKSEGIPKRPMWIRHMWGSFQNMQFEVESERYRPFRYTGLPDYQRYLVNQGLDGIFLHMNAFWLNAGHGPWEEHQPAFGTKEELRKGLVDFHSLGGKAIRYININALFKKRLDGPGDEFMWGFKQPNLPGYDKAPDWYAKLAEESIRRNSKGETETLPHCGGMESCYEHMCLDARAIVDYVVKVSRMSAQDGWDGSLYDQLGLPGTGWRKGGCWADRFGYHTHNYPRYSIEMEAGREMFEQIEKVWKENGCPEPLIQVEGAYDLWSPYVNAGEGEFCFRYSVPGFHLQAIRDNYGAELDETIKGSFVQGLCLYLGHWPDEKGDPSPNSPMPVDLFATPPQFLEKLRKFQRFSLGNDVCRYGLVVDEDIIGGVEHVENHLFYDPDSGLRVLTLYNRDAKRVAGDVGVKVGEGEYVVYSRGERGIVDVHYIDGVLTVPFMLDGKGIEAIRIVPEGECPFVVDTSFTYDDVGRGEGFYEFNVYGTGRHWLVLKVWGGFKLFFDGQEVLSFTGDKVSARDGWSGRYNSGSGLFYIDTPLVYTPNPVTVKVRSHGLRHESAVSIIVYGNKMTGGYQRNLDLVCRLEI